MAQIAASGVRGKRAPSLSKAEKSGRLDQETNDLTSGGRSNSPLWLDILYGETLEALLPPQLSQLLAGWRAA